ncbi:MAG: type II secretion system protein GspG [Planctomycetota bacterium]|nr:type II secretion system protein GspG [Planctomycetota bacterium]
MPGTLPLSALPLATLVAPPQDQPAETQPTQEPSPYLRLIEEDDGLRLELATRSFRYEREGEEDTIVDLVGVMHIADASYYDALQAKLDTYEVVLFEQVVPVDPVAGLVDVDPNERARVAATHRRLGVLLSQAMRYREEVGEAPVDANTLSKASTLPRVRRKITSSAKDAWGRPIDLQADEDGELSVVSLGADGETGGEGLDADIALHEDDAPPSEGQGIQKTLADALGLVFQLEGIDYASARWRRCDVTLAELQDLLEEGGADGNGILGALQGGSALEALASGLLRFMGATKSGRGMLKLVGIEALARAEDLMSAPPDGMEELFTVLLERRNDVVLSSIETLLAEEPDTASLAVFYGAAHMLDLERRLVDEVGLAPIEDSWLPAVNLRFEDTGLPMSTVRMMRKTISKAIDRQLKR